MNNKSKLNSVKHGILAKQMILSPEDSRPFNKLTRQLLAELEPANALEALMAEQIIVNYWRLRRFLDLENEVFLFAGREKRIVENRDFANRFTDFVRENPSFDLLSRYNATILRSFYRAIHEYRNLKMSKNLKNMTPNPPND